MSISSEITRISNAKTAIAESIANKGVTVPSGTKIDGMATLIDSIQTGGAAVQPSKALTVTSNGTTTITPDAPYDAIKQVNLTVNVASGGGGDGFKITFPTTAKNWNNAAAAYLILSNGARKPFISYSSVSGQTIENVVGIICRANDPIDILTMTLSKGKIAQINNLTSESHIITAPSTTIPYYASGNQTFWWPISDVVISAIEMYNTD